MDKTSLNLISIVLGGVGLFVVLTKFSVPELHATFLGSNPFAAKRDTIESVMTWLFTGLTLLGLLVQVGGLLIATVGPKARLRLPTARVFEPGLTPRPRVVEAFLRMQQEIARLLREGTDLDWRGVRLSSPVNRLFRLNLGDAYVILVIHTQRHLNQVARIRDALPG